MCYKILRRQKSNFRSSDQWPAFRLIGESCVSSGLINIASIDREAVSAALDARAHGPDEELFFHGKQVGLQA
jgi:hypothetical protein